MIVKRTRLLSILPVLFILSGMFAANAQAGGHVDVLTVGGVIDPWVANYIQRGIGLAESDGAEALVIVLNTPGGALEPMQDITTRMLNARVPVVVFVYPSGAWAASAGTFITLAANIAAMAPGTAIGAAHPVTQSGQDIQGTEGTKVTNFSTSLLQSIAQQRGRNADWAAKAVQDSVSATAQEALDQNVIDLLANNLNDLMNQIDGRTVETAAGQITLHTQRVGLTYVNMNLVERFFHTLVDPNVALVLLVVGLIGIAVELYNPGAIVPAVIGGICLVLAFISFGSLPVNWGGAVLVVLSIVAFIVDVKVNSVVLTVGGLAMFVLGALLLFAQTTPQSPVLPAGRVSPYVIAALGGTLVAFFAFALSAVVRGRRYPVMSGREALIGATGIARSDLDPTGTVHVSGEIWTAIAQGGAIREGESVRVLAVEGLRLRVVAQEENDGTHI
ncbi:MAG: NfeD family protein [Anaerolineae bacterium]